MLRTLPSDCPSSTPPPLRIPLALCTRSPQTAFSLPSLPPDSQLNPHLSVDRGIRPVAFTQMAPADPPRCPPAGPQLPSPPGPSPPSWRAAQHRRLDSCGVYLPFSPRGAPGPGENCAGQAFAPAFDSQGLIHRVPTTCRDVRVVAKAIP